MESAADGQQYGLVLIEFALLGLFQPALAGAHEIEAGDLAAVPGRQVHIPEQQGHEAADLGLDPQHVAAAEVDPANGS